MYVSVKVVYLNEVEQGYFRVFDSMLLKMPDKCTNFPQLLDMSIGEKENGKKESSGAFSHAAKVCKYKTILIPPSCKLRNALSNKQINKSTHQQPSKPYQILRQIRLSIQVEASAESVAAGFHAAQGNIHQGGDFLAGEVHTKVGA